MGGEIEKLHYLDANDETVNLLAGFYIYDE